MTFPTSTPSEQGIDPTRLVRFLDAIEADPTIEPHGLVIHRHGRRVLETYWRPHRAEQLRLVYSLSKSFTGTALGLAVGDGLVSLDDLVSDHLPDLMADSDERTRSLLVRHIASMATGHQDETLLDAFLVSPNDPLRGFFSLTPEHEPGTWFAYNQPPVLALAALLQRAFGARLTDVLRERVLDPIGVGGLRWYQYRPGVDLGFSGVFTNLDAVARLGQLHLDDGVHDGVRLLPEGWVAQAASVQIDNSHGDEPDWAQGYGFQLWMCRHGYRGDGAYGQYMLVLPEQDAVVAFLSHTEPMQPFLDHVWAELLPAFRSDAGASGADGPTDAAATGKDADGDRAVARRTADLRLPTAADRTGHAASLSSSPFSSAATGRFVRNTTGVGSHPSVTAVDVEHDGTDGAVLTIHEGDVAVRIPLSTDWTDVDGQHISTSAAVGPDGGVTVEIVLLASPHRLELTTDPSSSTFTASWPLFPLFGLGLDDVLHRVRPPES